MVAPLPSPAAPGSLLEELQALWRTATPDTIGPALRDARVRVAGAPAGVQDQARELIQSLEQLERWLHDR